MTLIKAQNLSIEFPIYSFTGHRSFKKNLINIATGGVLAKDAVNRPVVRALEDINLEFLEGDRVGLLGHNGSGKTTLLQVLTGIYEPTHGELQVYGSVTSMLGITLGMDPEISGRENIFLRGRLMGLSSKKIRELTDEIIDFAGIGDFIGLPLRTYSSGMAMRLAFATVTSVNADIVLMDEWLSVGDADFQQKANNRLTNFVDKARLVVIASHDRDFLDKTCNVLITLEHGKIVDSIRLPEE